jgi:hypothetical protein
MKTLDEIIAENPALADDINSAIAQLQQAASARLAIETQKVSDLTAQAKQKDTDIAELTRANAAAEAAKDAADKVAADATTAKAEVIAARDKATSELAAMTAQDQKHAAALLAALDWQAIDAEYADLQAKLAANSAKYDAARVKLEDLAAAINAPFAEREAAAKAARVKELEAQLAAAK